MKNNPESFLHNWYNRQEGINNPLVDGKVYQRIIYAYLLIYITNGLS
ncbi:hypothetical protein P22_0815 [Propionispora sp. 2/2-37]|nr:hypothetical protein P22_0815 [Propionispora sp. 2/2-37]